MFYRDGNKITLQPRNPTMQPIILENPDHFEIKGRVVKVIPRLRLS